MPKRKVIQTVIVYRNGARIKPAIGEIFDFEPAELESINKINPDAISRPVIEVDVENATAQAEAEAKAKEAADAAKAEAEAKAKDEETAAAKASAKAAPVSKSKEAKGDSTDDEV